MLASHEIHLNKRCIINIDVNNTIFAYLAEMSEYPAGPPSALYYGMEFDEKDIDTEICVPANKLMGGKGELQGRALQGGRMVSTLHMGPYHQVADAYQALNAWVKENGYSFAGPAREIYLVGKGQVEDEADYRTEILIPVAEAWLQPPLAYLAHGCFLRVVIKYKGHAAEDDEGRPNGNNRGVPGKGKHRHPGGSRCSCL